MDVECGQPRVHKERSVPKLWRHGGGEVAFLFGVNKLVGRARGGRERRKTYAYEREIADEGASGAVTGMWVVCECAAAESPNH